MYKDIFGNERAKIALHIHTARSDGHVGFDEAIEIYREAGFDAIAITDHWKTASYERREGITVLSGCEYNVGSKGTDVYHIVSLMTESEPQNLNTYSTPQEIIDEIHRCGGLAVLAHPAWSLNTPEDIMKLSGIDATEIYNSVSDVGMSYRPDSSLIVDMLGARGVLYPLLATDDAHYYGGLDNCRSYIMARCDPTDEASVKAAIKSGDFYATQGPEIHLSREGNVFRVDSSPVSMIAFASDLVWAPGRVYRGEGLTHAEYTATSDGFVRAFVIDGQGRYAWSNAIRM